MSTAKMPPPKINAFFEEFPWLSEYHNRDYVNSISVKRVGIEILHKTPETVDLDWIVDAYHKSERILFLDESGKEIGRVGHYYDPPKANFRWWKPNTWGFGWIVIKEDINEALIRHGDKAPIRFILSSFQGTVIIYKAPKGYSVQGWMKHQQELERAAIQNECAQIDAT